MAIFARYIIHFRANCMCVSADSRQDRPWAVARPFPPVFDEVDSDLPSSAAKDVTDSAPAYPDLDLVDGEMYARKMRSEIVEVFMDRGEQRQAGIGLVGQLFKRRYRRSHGAKLRAQMASVDMHR